MAVLKRLILKSASCFRCFQHLSLTLVATLHANEITTGSLEESSPRSSRTEGKSLQSLKRSNEKETELTHVALNPATCPYYLANNQTLGSCFTPRLGRADIEVANPTVDRNSHVGLPCYPRRSFNQLSDIFSI